MNISKYLEMRNLVLIEPETDEFVQVTYLCDMDSHMSESEILNRLGGLRDVGNAKTYKKTCRQHKLPAFFLL